MLLIILNVILKHIFRTKVVKTNFLAPKSKTRKVLIIGNIKLQRQDILVNEYKSNFIKKILYFFFVKN